MNQDSNMKPPSILLDTIGRYERLGGADAAKNQPIDDLRRPASKGFFLLDVTWCTNMINSRQ